MSLPGRTADTARLLYLDGLRAIAAWMVVFQHYSSPKSIFKKIGLDWGMIGVQFFFVLSGFLITSLLMSRYSDTEGRGKACVDFWISRIARIVPLVLLSLGFLACLDYPEKDWREFVSGLTFTVNFLVLNGFDGRPGFFAHFWTLGVEMQFYLFYPFLFWALPKDRRVEYLLAIILALLLALPLLNAISPWPRPDLLLPWRADAFLLGGLVACLGRDRRKQISVYLTIAGAIGLVGVAVGNLLKIEHMPDSHIVAVLGAGIIAGLPYWPKVSALLSLRPLVYLGQISYGIYVWHIILLAMWPFFIEVGSRLGITMKLRPTMTVLTLLVAMLSWHFVERPIIQYAKRTLQRRSGSQYGADGGVKLAVPRAKPFKRRTSSI